MIKRKLERQIAQSLTRFPVVGLVGSRQVGKTTLARGIASSRGKKAVYLDLERPSDLAKLDQAELYLRQFEDRLVVLDEIHRKPEIFPLLRSLVDDAPDQPGRFLVLGSASPELLRQSSESLAGRIIYHELSPFLFEELVESDFRPYWCRGGYPPSFLAKSEGESLEWRESFIRTYLERDIPQLGFRIPAAQLRRFWEMLAQSHGQLWNASKISASLGISAPAVRRYLDLLEDTFLVRQLAPFHANVKKRLVKSPKIYLRDTGILHAILRIDDLEALYGSPHAGASFEGFVLAQVAAKLPASWPIYFYRTAAGAEVDIVLLPPKRPPVAVEIKFSLAPRLTKGFHHALVDIGGGKSFVVYPGTESFPLSENVIAVPVTDMKALFDAL